MISTIECDNDKLVQIGHWYISTTCFDIQLNCPMRMMDTTNWMHVILEPMLSDAMKTDSINYGIGKLEYMLSNWKELH